MLDDNDKLDLISENLADLKKNQEDLKTNQQLLIQEHEYSKTKVDEIHLSVYDPDRGIYRRLNDSLTRFEKHEEQIEELKDEHNELKEDHEENQLTINSLIVDQKAIKDIAGQNYEELAQVVAAQKFVRKFFWLIIPPVVAFIFGHYVL